MRPNLKRLTRLLILIGVVAMSDANGQGSSGILRTFIGQDALALREKSAFKVNLGTVKDAMLYATDQPVVVEYGTVDGAIRFPPASFLSLDIVAGHVIGLRIMPQLNVLTVTQAMDLVNNLNAMLARHGWTRPQPGLTGAEAAIRLSAPQGNPQRVDFGNWKGPGDDTLAVQVESSPPLGWSLQRLIGGNHRDCKITVMINSDLAFKRFATEVSRLRAEDGLGDVPARSIDLPSYLKRVRR